MRVVLHGAKPWPFRALLLMGGVAAMSLTGASAATVSRDPYLQNVTSNAISVRWRTDEATDSRVRFGREATALTEAVFNADLTTEHEVRLASLEPDTRYFYAIGSSGGDLAAGPELHFSTAPVASRPIRLWVAGDTRRSIQRTTSDSRSDVRDAFLRYSADRPADLCFNTGDLADSGYDYEMQRDFFSVYAGPFRNTPIVPCLGNHDLGIAAGQAYLDNFTVPANGEAGGVPSRIERYYSFNYGPIHFVILDCYGTNGIYTQQLEENYKQTQLSWLRQDLTTNTQRWLIAMFHSPPYSFGSHNSDAEWDLIGSRTYFIPVLEEFGADVVLNGHSHNYERSCLLRGHYGSSSTLTTAMKVDGGNGRPGGDGAYYKPNAQAGTVYVVMGCSGFLGPGVYGHPAMVYSANDVGSMVVDIQENVLQARFLRDTGAIDDYFVIIKGTQPPAARITSTQIDTGGLRLRWETVEGYRYRVYRRPTLNAAREQLGSDLLATGFGLEWTNPVDAQRASAFYDVETVPEP